MIRQGQHFSTLKLVKILKPLQVVGKVSFDESCKYNLSEPDKYDWNKLFGITFIDDAGKDNPVHVDSARWAWRYNPDTEEFEFSPYCYVSKKVFKDFCIYKTKTVDNLELELKVDYINKIYLFYVKGELIYSLDYEHKKYKTKVEYPYFGGTQAAPQTITIKISLVIF